jgi:hypothetical protein
MKTILAVGVALASVGLLGAAVLADDPDCSKWDSSTHDWIPTPCIAWTPHVPELLTFSPESSVRATLDEATWGKLILLLALMQRNQRTFDMTDLLVTGPVRPDDQRTIEADACGRLQVRPAP